MQHVRSTHKPALYSVEHCLSKASPFSFDSADLHHCHQFTHNAVRTFSSENRSSGKAVSSLLSSSLKKGKRQVGNLRLTKLELECGAHQTRHPFCKRKGETHPVFFEIAEEGAKEDTLRRDSEE